MKKIKIAVCLLLMLCTAGACASGKKEKPEPNSQEALQKTQVKKSRAAKTGASNQNKGAGEKPPTGLYIGIISFANDADDITKSSAGVSLLLDKNEDKEMLLQQIDYVYALSREKNNALYYAVHKAIKNIIDGINEKTLPDDLTSINIIAVTSGLDNASSNPNLPDIGAAGFASSKKTYVLQKNERLKKDAYSKFLSDLIRDFNREKTVKINLFIYDAANPELIDSLGGILGAPVQSLNDLQSLLVDIPSYLESLNSFSVLNAILPPLYDGAEILIEVEKGKNIKGIVRYDAGNTPVLKDIGCTPEDLLQSRADIAGIQEGDSFVYQFKLNKNLDSVRNKESVYININSMPMIEQSSVIHIFSSKELTHNSMIMYFVLDNGVNVGEDNIQKIKSTVRSIIDYTPYNKDEEGSASADYERDMPDQEESGAAFGEGKATEGGAAAGGAAESGATAMRQNAPKAAEQVTLRQLLDTEAARLWIPKLSYSDSSLEAPGSLDYWVQIAAFVSKRRAVANLNMLHDNGISNSSIFYRKKEEVPYKLRIGPYNTRADAMLAIDALRKLK